MADQEHNDRFIICLTPSNGTQIICNPDAVTLFFKLLEKEQSAMDLSKSTGIPNNTVRDRLNKMLSEGVISNRTCETDSRRTLYRCNAQILIADHTHIPWNYSLNNRPLTTHGPDSIQNVFVQMIIDTYIGYGIDPRPMLMAAGADLISVEEFKSYFHKEDGSLTACTTQKNKDNEISLEVAYRGGITISIKSSNNIDDGYTLFLFPLIGALIRHLPQLTDRNYCFVPKLTYSNNGHLLTVSVPPFSGLYIRDGNPPTSEWLPDFHKYSKPFAVCSVDGHPIMITNTVMLSILNSMDSPKTTRDLYELIPFSKVSIHSALNKLLEIKAILSEDPLKKKNRIFKINCTIVMTSTGPVSIPDAQVGDCSFFENQSQAIYAYAEKMHMKMGINSKTVLDIACRRLSEYIENNNSESLSFETIREALSSFDNALKLEYRNDRIMITSSDWATEQ